MNSPITNIKAGKEATIVKLTGGRGFQKRLRTIGVREGKIIKIVTKHPLGGPIVIEVEGRMVTIGRGMAQRIIVELKDEKNYFNGEPERR